jgi:4-carboxymuconolactone decarboxylase
MSYEPQFTDEAKAYCERLFGTSLQLDDNDLADTDPEYAERIANFAFDQVVNANDLDDENRALATLAVLIGSQSQNAFELFAHAFLAADFINPVQLKEVVYQATAYLGIGRVLPFLDVANVICQSQLLDLPLEGQAQTTMETRREAGTAKQVQYFGPQMEEFWKQGTINEWLAANCFGDYYTRAGLTDQQREMITFCYLIAQGGCEPQATSHAMANIKLSSKNFMKKVIEQVMPYIGYPRTLNALTCLENADEALRSAN